MKKTYLITFLSILLIFTAQCVHAQSIKVIMLKDGSNIQGKILSMQDHVYAIDTAHMGLINVHENDIQSIADPSQNVILNKNINSLSGNSNLGSNSLKSQVDQIQGSIMSDPQILMELQKLVEDPEIMKILSDENFVSDIMSYDENKIKNNANTNNLLQNQKMRALMDKINKKLGPTK